MRIFPNTICEKDLILEGIIEDLRIDNRKCDEYRPLNITLGKQRGTCFVELGNTKSFACVSAEIVTPKQGRPYSGLLQINLNMSPMAAPNFESARLGERGIEISRLIERVLKESNCLDLESLCIVSNEKVWQIQADVHVIDNDGSIIDCASIAVMCALKSFRRPDVTISGESYIVHSPEDRPPVPLSLYHTPVCITFGLTEDGKCITVDPTEREQYALDGEIVVAMNSHKEVCTIHCSGKSLIKKIQVLRCISMAAQRSKEIAEMIKGVFEEDTVDRSKHQKCGFSTLIRPTKQMCGSFRVYDIVTNLNNNLQNVATNKKDDQSIKIVQNSAKTKGQIFKTNDVKSPKLMTQRDEENEENDDMAIVDEILSVKVEKSTKVEGLEEELLKDDVVISAVKTKNKEKRRQRMKKKDDDVAQLLMDIECDGKANSKNKSEEDLQIVGEFKATKKGKSKVI